MTIKYALLKADYCEATLKETEYLFGDVQNGLGFPCFCNLKGKSLLSATL